MSVRNSEYARQPLDLYETPSWVVDCLAEHLLLGGKRVWECAAGKGKMVAALKSHGATVLATDIRDYGIGQDFRGVFDFTSELACPWVEEFDVLATNPPYGERGHLATAFIYRGIKSIAQRGAMALLLPVDFDSAKGRAHLFGENPYFAGKIVLRRRIQWFDQEPDEEKRAGPSVNHAWFIHTAPVFRHRQPPFVVYSPSLEVEMAA